MFNYINLGGKNKGGHKRKVASADINWRKRGDTKRRSVLALFS